MKVKVESYTLRGKEKIIHEPVISDEYWTEHKNFDGSILKVKVTPVTELNERNSVDEGEKSTRPKKCIQGYGTCKQPFGTCDEC